MRSNTRNKTLIVFVCLPILVCAISHTSSAEAGRPPAFEERMVMNEARANLPNARGQVFHDLDSYLAHLKRLGTMDIPFWEEIAPGLYRYNTGRGMNRQNPQMATREELMRRFGFTR